MLLVLFRLAIVLGLAVVSAGLSEACTSLLVTKGASNDGSVMITYTCDGRFHPHFEYTAAADHEPGDSLEITDWRGNSRGWIAQAEHTYAHWELMNEHQLVIGETTFDGRKELRNPDGILHYWDLMVLALQRASTAREAITVITDLVAEYGYGSTGESISIGDKHEAWVLEIIGPGEGGRGAEWVAVRVPDGHISAHANKARIGRFPLDDPENCRYSKNVISFAVEKGYYDPDSGEPFRFCDIYDPPDPKNRRYCEMRVWSALRRAAPSLNLSPDYHRSVPGAEDYPWSIKPDNKLSIRDVFALMRDHYEGTPYDMTQGVDAGPYGCPKRWRPLFWTIDSVEYTWERPISTQQTGFSFVSQSRSWLPDAIGGVYWGGVDDTYTTCYTPFYCCINAVPKSFRTGKFSEFTWESAFWIFNFVANFANLRFNQMAPEITAVQQDIESTYVAVQPALDRAAMELHETDPDMMVRFLTDYCVSQAEMMIERWRDLAKYLIVKYNDGYVQNEPGRAEQDGYPEAWLRTVLEHRAEELKLPEQSQGTPESELTD